LDAGPGGTPSGQDAGTTPDAAPPPDASAPPDSGHICLGPECPPCEPGFERDLEGACSDVNECLEENGGCDPLTECFNTAGTHFCGPCPADGYTGDGETGCIPDPCFADNGGCDSITSCTASPQGDPLCGPCPFGYHGDGINGCNAWVEGLAAGAFHTCADLLGDTVKCWGANSEGQLGLGHTSNMGLLPGDMGQALPAVDLWGAFSPGNIDVSAGGSHSCAVLWRYEGPQLISAAKCWGNNSSGQLGLGDTANRGDDPNEMGMALPEIDLGTNVEVVSLVSGDAHNCAIVEVLPNATRGVKCWGDNSYGQLGLGDAENRGDDPGEMGDALPLVDLGNVERVNVLKAGGNQTCASYYVFEGLNLIHETKCWGAGTHGVLGSVDALSNLGDDPGEMGSFLEPVDVGTGTSEIIGVGASFACAHFDYNTGVKCWGNNSSGQLGLGDSTQRGISGQGMGDALPLLSLPPDTDAHWGSAGHNFMCLRLGLDAIPGLDDGSFYCWGENTHGQLGLGHVNPIGTLPGHMGSALLPVDLPMEESISIFAAGGAHVCAVMGAGPREGELYCWGSNDQGQLGLGVSDDRGDGSDEMGDALPFVVVGR
jgi:alpha-tubulin suppressor-like RCC1 family protein